MSGIRRSLDPGGGGVKDFERQAWVRHSGGGGKKKKGKKDKNIDMGPTATPADAEMYKQRASLIGQTGRQNPFDSDVMQKILAAGGRGPSPLPAPPFGHSRPFGQGDDRPQLKGGYRWASPHTRNYPPNYSPLQPFGGMFGDAAQDVTEAMQDAGDIMRQFGTPGPGYRGYPFSPRDKLLNGQGMTPMFPGTFPGAMDPMCGMGPFAGQQGFQPGQIGQQGQVRAVIKQSSKIVS